LKKEGLTYVILENNKVNHTMVFLIKIHP